MGKHYGYDYDLACKYGSDAASIIDHFKYWIDSNRARSINFKDGRTWSYQTVEYIKNHYPWLSLNTVKRILKVLVDEKILLRGHLHPDPTNRTTWYAFVNEDEMIGISPHQPKMGQCTTTRVSEEILTPEPMESHWPNLGQCIGPEWANVISNTITIDTDTKEKKKEMSAKADSIRLDQFQRLKERYPRKEHAERAKKAFLKLKHVDEDLMHTMFYAIDEQERKRTNQALTNKDGWHEAWPLLASWINAERWEDEVYDPVEEKRQKKANEMLLNKLNELEARGKLHV